MSGRGAAASIEIDCSAFGAPRLGERLSGDVAVIERTGAVIFIALVDVLGHGDDAHAVASRAESFLRERWDPDPARTLLALHEELRGTRGAVAGVCVLDSTTGGSRFSGIGDTGIVTVGAHQPSLYSKEGILGSRIRTPIVQQFRLEPGDILVLHSDGVASDFRASLPSNSNSVKADELACRIVQRFRRRHDDATCIVAAVRSGR